MDSTITWSILCCTLFLSSTEAEIFTAISDVEPLLETHKLIIHNIDDYLDKEENRINVLKQHLNHYKKEHDKAMEDIPNYLGNPINAFTLIKRLTTDLIYLERGIKMGTEYNNNVSISQLDQKYPEVEDLMGAAQALTRLQGVYYLKVEDLSEGILNGVTYSTSMTASDCFELGRALFNQKDFTNAIAWMKAALRKFHENNLDYPVEEADILEYIIFSYYEQGDDKKAMKWIDKLLQLEPDHVVRAKGNIPNYKNIIADIGEKLKRKKKGETGDDDEVDPEKKEAPITSYVQELKPYEALCRGETDVPREIAQRLKCYYLTENHPFLRLAPIKAEQVYINPDIVIFHQVISDDEIEFLQNNAKPRFKRATVRDATTANGVAADYRISKSAWFMDEESPFIAKIAQRVADMTGLNMWSAEYLQVANYGIGGHFVPHYDFTAKDETPHYESIYGNRIATVLFYMSEVSHGGATVFPKLGLSVVPIKNAAIFWMNLHLSGEGDLDTMHGACPVLRGSKWVCTKWIRLGGQELIKPCNLEYQQENTVRKTPRAVPKSFR